MGNKSDKEANQEVRHSESNESPSNHSFEGECSTPSCSKEAEFVWTSHGKSFCLGCLWAYHLFWKCHQKPLDPSKCNPMYFAYVWREVLRFAQLRLGQAEEFLECHQLEDQLLKNDLLVLQEEFKKVAKEVHDTPESKLEEISEKVQRWEWI